MSGSRENGLIIGIVTNLDDPEKLGRVKVSYPYRDDQESDWARVVSIMAGPERGAFFRPEEKDEVLVGLEQGDPRRPYILGAVWSKEDKPPPDDGNAVKNNWRFFRSRSGHVIKMDDTKKAEKVEIIGKGEKHKIIIDVSGDKIQICADSGDIEVKAPKGKVSIKASEIKAEATGNMSLEAGGTMTIKGATVNIN